jgi:putative ABC transport system permease protein
MRIVTLKGLLAHRLRLALTTLSVVLGVAFVAGTFILTDTMSGVFDELVRGGAASVDVMVRAEVTATGDTIENLDAQLPPVQESVLDEVLAVDGVARADGVVEGYAMIVRPDGEAITPMGPPTLGGAWTPEGDRIILDGGRAPTAPDEVAIDRRTAARNDLQPGDQVSMVFASTPPRPFTVVGISSTEDGSDSLAGASFAEFERSTAHEVLDLDGMFSAISVWTEQGVDPDTLVTRLEAALPAGLNVITAADWADEMMVGIDEALGFFTAIFGVFALVAVIVGAFIIANTFSITVLQRSREFALLRALGASRRQIVGSVVGEAVVVGLLASIVGVVAGLGLAVALGALLSIFGLDMPSGALVLRPRTIVVALGVGLTVTIISSLLPARRAAGTHPMAALRAVTQQAYRPSPLRLGAGIVAAVAALALGGVAAVGQPDNAGLLVGAAALLALGALGASGPSLTRPILRLFGGSGARFGVVGRLARSNSLRTPRRTWTTAAALTIGLALVSSVAVMGASLKASASEAMEGFLRADAILTATNSMSGGTVPPVVAREVSELPAVGAVSAVRGGPGEIDGAAATIIAVDPGQWDAVAATTFTAGSIGDLAAADAVAVDVEVAREHGYQLGDVLPAAFPASGPLELQITAMFEPDQLLSGWVTSTQTHAELFTGGGDAAVLIAGADGVGTEPLLAAVEQATAAYPAVLVQDQAQFRDGMAAQVDQLLALVTALLGMALFVAVLGIMNTLALSIHERTHEIGLLRAVGMTRSQVRRMIRWEAVTVALLGAVVGLVLGLVFGWATTRALADEGITAFVLPIGQLIGAVLLAAVAGVLAAVLPARAAAKLDVLRAVTVE